MDNKGNDEEHNDESMYLKSAGERAVERAREMEKIIEKNSFGRLVEFVSNNKIFLLVGALILLIAKMDSFTN